MLWAKEQSQDRTRRAALGQLARFGALIAMAGLLAGCFQPLYAERTAGGEPAIRDKLAAIDVAPINPQKGTRESRLGIEVRNALLFNFTGGGANAAQNYRLDVHLVTSRSNVIIDVNTSRRDIENYGIDATYKLIDITSGETILTGQTFTRVSYDIPGQQQRFARDRGFRDAENRACRVIADNITQRLASYLATGG